MITCVLVLSVLQMLIRLDQIDKRSTIGVASLLVEICNLGGVRNKMMYLNIVQNISVEL